MEKPAEPRVVLVKDTATIGALVRSRRKAAGLTQAQAAGLAGVGNRFLSELERGKERVELHLVLQVLERLGFELAIAPRGSRLFTEGPPKAPRSAEAPSEPEGGPETPPAALRRRSPLKSKTEPEDPGRG